MSKKFIVLILCFFSFSLLLESSSVFKKNKNKNFVINKSFIPDGTYHLASIYLCESYAHQKEECKFERYLVKGSGSISLSRLLEGQYRLVLKGHSKASVFEKQPAFGCKKGMIDAYVFFDNISILNSIISPEEAISADSSQVRISQNTCIGDETNILNDGNFIGSYFYFRSLGKLYLQQTKILKGGRRIELFSEFEKS
jgi:hypothetical protein